MDPIFSSTVYMRLWTISHTPSSPKPGARALILFAVVCLAALFASPRPSLAISLSPASVTLAWDPSPSVSVVGYRLYYGTSPRTYTYSIDAGPSTTVTLSNLLRGTTYYMAVTAYDSFGLESEFSEEVAYTPPLVEVEPTPTIALTKIAGGQMQLTGTAPSGTTVSVQASVDMQNWITISSVTADSNGHLLFTDQDASAHTQRFYRFIPD
jgi:fibronectin type 3 domain-containing protein